MSASYQVTILIFVAKLKTFVRTCRVDNVRKLLKKLLKLPTIV
jgi:hypothetical protein